MTAHGSEEMAVRALQAGAAVMVTSHLGRLTEGTPVDEVAVDGFLRGRIRYTQIPSIIEHCLDDSMAHGSQTPSSLAEILDLDARTRSVAAGFCQAR